ncbi:hypothetical protein [Pendulispora albinea]|uniref:Uncharacterized protein n=1 Tax=Pendulispora albinea TaxID=2741071 RepID=A0ABZ2MAN1_9BACT
MMALSPREAVAVRPFITDDARVVGDRAAQLETWLRVDEAGPQHWTVVAAGPWAPLEVSAGGFYGRTRGEGTMAAPLLQLKALALETRPGAIIPGLAVVAGAFGPFGAGPLKVAGWDTFGYIALTESLEAHDRVLLHQNVGFFTTTQAEGRHVSGTWGIGTQIRMVGGLHVVGEVFSGDPYADAPGGAFQTGVRHFVSSSVQVDATVGAGIFGESLLPAWGSIGFRIASDPNFW